MPAPQAPVRPGFQGRPALLRATVALAAVLAPHALVLGPGLAACNRERPATIDAVALVIVERVLREALHQASCKALIRPSLLALIENGVFRPP